MWLPWSRGTNAGKELSAGLLPSRKYGSKGVAKQHVLDGAGKYLVTVTHIEVKHVVPSVAPNDRKVAGEQHVFKAKWVV